MPKNILVFVFCILFAFCACHHGGGSKTPPSNTTPPVQPTPCIVKVGEEVPSSLWVCYPKSMPPSLRAGNPGTVTSLPILAPPPIPAVPSSLSSFTTAQTSQYVAIPPPLPPLAPITNPCFVYMQWSSIVRLSYTNASDQVTGAACAWRVDAPPSFATNGGAIAVTASILLSDSIGQKINFIQTGFEVTDTGILQATFFVTDGTLNTWGALINMPYGDTIETWSEFKETVHGESFWEAWAYDETNHKEYYLGTLSLPTVSVIRDQYVLVLVDDIVNTEKTTVLPNAVVNQGFASQTLEAFFGGIGDNEALWLTRGSGNWFTPSYARAFYNAATFTLYCNTSSTDSNEPINNNVEPLNGLPGKLTFKAGVGISRTTQDGDFNWR